MRRDMNKNEHQDQCHLIDHHITVSHVRSCLSISRLTRDWVDEHFKMFKIQMMWLSWLKEAVVFIINQFDSSGSTEHTSLACLETELIT